MPGFKQEVTVRRGDQRAVRAEVAGHLRSSVATAKRATLANVGAGDNSWCHYGANWWHRLWCLPARKSCEGNSLDLTGFSPEKACVPLQQEEIRGKGTCGSFHQRMWRTRVGSLPTEGIPASRAQGRRSDQAENGKA
jgi:hypothetical protein